MGSIIMTDAAVMPSSGQAAVETADSLEGADVSVAFSEHADPNGATPSGNQPLPQQAAQHEQHRAASASASGCVLGTPVHFPQARDRLSLSSHFVFRLAPYSITLACLHAPRAVCIDASVALSGCLADHGVGHASYDTVTLSHGHPHQCHAGKQ